MSRSEEKIKILVSCHKPAALIENEVLTPIQLNAAKSDVDLGIKLKDDEGDNISELNPMYCELTAQYWAWKNLKSGYYGFCHYRRYFSFSEKLFPEDGWGNVVEKYPGGYVIEKYKLDSESITNLVEQYDVIMTKRQDLHKMPIPSSSVREQYKKAPHLHVKDLDLMVEIIDEKYPEYSQTTHKFIRGHIACFCNMYILKKEIFFRYADFVFGVLNEFCKRVDMSLYDTEALRTPGHLSERLFNIFILQLEKENPGIKIKELQSVFFEKTEPQDDIVPIFKNKDKTIPIVFAANNDFTPMFAVCLQSLIEHRNNSYNYDIILIQSDIDAENKRILTEMIKPYNNMSLRFYDATGLLSDYELKANAHISVETYYRFLIQDAMPKYKKVLYLDCDLVINRDVSELYDTVIHDYILAATRDPDFLGQINGANKKTMKYVKTRLKMKNPYDYFQAGVILFNEDKMREKHSVDEWLKIASEPFMYNDQDILNLECEGSVKYLDMKWGMIVDHAHSRRKDVISFAPDKIQKEYDKAHANPAIIHYAGFRKPWYDPNEDYAKVFWKYAKKTVYYEILIAKMYDFNYVIGAGGRGGLKRRVKSKMKYAFDKTYSKVAPYGSRRWMMLKKMQGKEY